MCKDKPKPADKKAEGWRAVNPVQFSLSYNENTPHFSELSKGQAVDLDVKNKIVQNWIDNNVITKE